MLSQIKQLRGKFFQLCIVAFGAGAVVMSLELTVSRILTPVFGSSTYTWGNLIGLILIGLSLGYVLGGKIADKDPKFRKICLIIFSAGLYVVFVPFLAPGILGFTLEVFQQNQFSSLFATFALVFFPTALLGFVSPYAIRLGVKTLHKVGNVSGTLYAVATLGSIFGTFLTIFVLIPVLDIRTIIFGLGVVLMVLSSLGLRLGPKILAIIVIIILFTPSSSIVTGLMSHNGELVLEEETQYSHLDIVDVNNQRILYLNGLRHSQMSLDNPTELVLEYSKYFHLGQVFTSKLDNVLFVGGGGFSGPKNFLETYPNSLIDVVEIDADVIDAAKKYFAVESTPRLNIFNEDARIFLTNNDKTYDLIILDAFASDYVPFHLLTEEYFQILDNRLDSDGVVLSNLIGSVEGDTSDLPRSVYKTMKTIFPTVYVFTTEGNISAVQNLIFVATKDSMQFDKSELETTIKNQEIPSEADFIENYYETELRIDDVPVLTDGFSPVEVMINPLTSQPYFNDDSVFSSYESKWWFNESTAVKVGLLIIVVFVWLFVFRHYWKSPIEVKV